MVRVTTIKNPRMGQAFVDYMAARRITVGMMRDEESDDFVLFLKESEHYDLVMQELEQFLANPNADKYHAASWEVADTRVNPFQYRSPSFIAMIKAKAGPITLAVMLLCVVIFVLQQIGQGRAIFLALHFPADANQQWQLWRWLSHAVLHFSALHIVFNLLWWWQLGGDIEQRLGQGKLLQLFVLSAALSGAGQYWVEGANFGGLSGVVYALVGYIWMMGYKAPALGLMMPKQVIGFMLVWLVLGFMQPFMAIANTAHLVGLLSGVGLGLLDASKAKYQG